jgi:type VI secretion system protein ImpE
MNAQELLQAGRLDEAIAALGAELREQPSDARRRMFLFELLCLAGNYDRAEKQLDILAEDDPSKRQRAMFYTLVLSAERLRQSMAASGDYPQTGGDSGPGSWNGTRFTRLEDTDPRQYSHFEFITAAGYHRIPMAEVASVEMDAPARLRDLIWSPARMRFRQRPDDTVDALIPVLTAGAFKHVDPQVRLGRVTVWEQQDGIEVPCGQRMFQADDTVWPVLELRNLTLDGTP